MDLNIEYESAGNDALQQDAILDSLFVACDSKSTGLVKVSKLIEYLSLVLAGDNVQFHGNFENLSLLLDPDGKDTEINIEKYRQGMEEWIEEIRYQNYGSEMGETQTPASFKGCMDTGDEWNTLEGSKNQGHHYINSSSESVEGVGGESPLKQDWELVTKIEDLQLNNKRLLDHNTELSFQMESTEETNAQLQEELEKLRKQLRSYQNMDEKNRTIEKENEELRQTVGELQETSRMFQNKAKQLEKDRMAMNDFQEELQTKLSAAHRRLESLSNDHKSVCMAYNEEKQKLIELEEQQGSKKEMNKGSSETYDYLTNVISQLSAQKESLQTERNKMEDELFHVREDLNRLMERSSSTFSPVSRSLYATPCSAVSTVTSLQQEIQELSADDCLPSPLVGCSTLFNHTCESDVFESSFQSKASNRVLSLSPLNSSLNSSITQVAVDFREKKEKVLHGISELLKLDKTRDTKEMKECLLNKLEKELEFFDEKIWLLSLARKASEKRASKLLNHLGNLREENKQLAEERDRALQKIGNLSLGSDDLETRVEDLSAKLEAAVKKADMLEKRCAQFHDEVNEARAELKEIKLQNENIEASTGVENTAETDRKKKYQNMKKIHDDLKKEHEDTVAKLRKLEKEFERTSMDLAVEKKRTFALQESLSLSVSKHEQELQEIMETIPNVTCDDLIDRKYSTSASRPAAITGHLVSSKLREFIANIHLAIRDSPDGKPKDDVPVGISTPLDDSSAHLDHKQSVSSELADESRSVMSGGPSASQTTDTPNKDQKLAFKKTETTQLRGKSCNTNDFRQRNKLSDSATDISPNLIQPFEDESDSLLSPNLVEPFDRNPVKNVTFTKVNAKELGEWNQGYNTGLEKGEDFDVAQSLGTDNSSDSFENCAKNLAQDFSGEASKHTSPSSSVTSCECSEDADDNESSRMFESVPTSPLIPSRFREISNVSGHRQGNGGDLGPEIAVQELPAEYRKVSTPLDGSYKGGDDQKLIFSFEGVDVEHAVEKAGGIRESSCRSSDSWGSRGHLERYDSDFRSSPNLVNSYIEGVSLNSKLPSDDKELERLFKSVSLAFRTDKDTLPQRLAYQERARNTAEDNVTKSLSCLSSGLKGLEETVSTDSKEQVLNDAIDSLCEQISELKESSRRVSSQSHQYGCYQQEARMMSGVDVLINYGENLSRRFETLSESVNAKEPQTEIEARLNHSKETKRNDKDPNELVVNTSGANTEELDQSSRRGSAFYSFMSSMRATDSFRLFRSKEDPKMSPNENKTVDSTELHEETSFLRDDLLGEKTEEVFCPMQEKSVRERSCLSSCLCWSIRLTMFFVLLLAFVFIAIQNSFIDRDFVIEQLHKYLKRFEEKHYGREPAT